MSILIKSSNVSKCKKLKVEYQAKICLRFRGAFMTQNGIDCDKHIGICTDLMAQC